MPPTCTICRHPERETIDTDLVAGTPYRHIAARTGTSTGALQRHKAICLSATLVKAKDVAEVVHAGTLLSKARAIENEARRLGRKAEQQGDLRAALLACRELARMCELMGRLVGAFHEETQAAGINVQILLLKADGTVEERILPAGENVPILPA
jgi:hypothetical protein